MTFAEALRAATEYGENLAERRPDSDSPPTRLPPQLRDAFDDARREALVGRAREAFWMRRYYGMRAQYAQFQHRLEGRA